MKKFYKNQEKVWDAIAEQWFHFRQKPFPDIDNLLKKLVNEWKKGKILDIGCGNCRNLIYFSKAGFDCYGIDFSKEMLKYAKIYLKKYNFKVKLKKANALNLPFKKESFDYILNIAVLHHIKGKEEREKAINEMYRVMKKDGEALISVWNKLSWKWLFKPKEIYLGWKIKDKVYLRYYYLFWPWEIKKLLKRHGFKIRYSNFFGKNIIILVKK